MADAVTAELREIGLEVEEDASGADTGSDAGNLLARIEGPEGARDDPALRPPRHRPAGGPGERGAGGRRAPQRATRRILGADNKAAVATMLGAARRLVADGSPGGGRAALHHLRGAALDGAKAVDPERLRSEYGFVFDHASPIGELVVASPTYYRLEARFLGHAAHAGIRPEAGRNAIAAAARAIAAMPNGRLDPETTANVGLIEGGTAANVVAERCVVELEARSLDEARAAEVVQAMVDAATEAAAYAECDVETEVERLFRGYRLPRTAPAVEVAAAALRSRGLEPSYIATGGGSDANVFVAAGLPVVNVANGTERNHQPDESVTVEALEQMLDVTLAIVAAGAG